MSRTGVAIALMIAQVIAEQRIDVNAPPVPDQGSAPLETHAPKCAQLGTERNPSVAQYANRAQAPITKIM